MRNYSSKLKFFEALNLFILNEEEVAERFTQIYSEGESSDSPRSFGFERAGKINFRIISKNSPHQKLCFGARLVQHRASLWCWV